MIRSILLLLLLLVGCQPMENATMQVRVLNNSSADFFQLWLGVGGRQHDTVAYPTLAAGETSVYQTIPAAYHGYGKINVTLATMERLPTIVLPGPDQGGPVFSAESHYTLIYEQLNGQWQVRFETE